MWSRLDHAAKLYATIASDSNSSTFRLFAELTADVDPAVLQKATAKTLERYRTFNVRLSGGFFWNFLARNPSSLLVEEESDYPCFPISSTGPGAHLVRVLYFRNRISVEFFHALTDGTGGLEFLKTLLYGYMSELGECFPTEGLLTPTDSIPQMGEDADGFTDYFDYWQENAAPVSSGSAVRARHLHGTDFDPAGHNVVEAVLESERLRKTSKELGVSVTALLVAVALKTLAHCDQRPDERPFVIAVPVNLRRVFPSRTLRNFFVVINVGAQIDPARPLPEVALRVKDQMTEKLSTAALSRAVADTMKFDQNLASRFIPNFIKRTAIRIGFKRFGQAGTTMTLSNLGQVELPAGMGQLVKRLGFHLYPDKQSPVNLASVSALGLTTISFSRSIVEADFIREFLTTIREQTGQDPWVTGNEWGGS